MVNHCLAYPGRDSLSFSPDRNLLTPSPNIPREFLFCLEEAFLLKYKIP